MTCEQLRHIRSKLGLQGKQFAQLLGVTTGSLHRWDSSKGGQLCIEPFRLQICVAVFESLNLATETQITALRSDLLNAFAKYGNLYALKVLLDFVYSVKQEE